MIFAIRPISLAEELADCIMDQIVEYVNPSAGKNTIGLMRTQNNTYKLVNIDGMDQISGTSKSKNNSLAEHLDQSQLNGTTPHRGITHETFIILFRSWSVDLHRHYY